MPMIQTKVNIPLDDGKREAIQSRLGEAIHLLGKTESWLMLSFEEGCQLYFQGKNDAAMAFCDVQLYGKADAAAYEKMTAAVTKILSEELAIDPAKIYIKYQEVEHWGWNGSNF